MDSTATTTERFADLFAGRRDAYGTEEGGCLRVTPAGLGVPCPYEDHLSGRAPIGVYPLVPRENYYGTLDQTWVVKWGCVDLDVKGPTHATGYESQSDAFDAACNMVAALEHFGVTSWVEETRSGGYHVWVFAREWVPAATMRRALLIACAVADVPPTEVNPKAESQPDASVLGNYVRLPYPGGANATTRRVAADGEWLTFEQFVDDAYACRTPTYALNALAELYTPPHTESNVVLTGEVELDETLRRRLSGLTWTVLRDGPLEGQDRSGTLFRLAHLCKADDLDPDETFAVVKAGDEAWGKFHRRPNGDRYLREIVERAWSE